MKFRVIIEQDEEGKFTGTVPDLKGCYSWGDTLDELMKNVKEAIEAHIEAAKKEKKSCKSFASLVFRKLKSRFRREAAIEQSDPAKSSSFNNHFVILNNYVELIL